MSPTTPFGSRRLRLRRRTAKCIAQSVTNTSDARPVERAPSRWQPPPYLRDHDGSLLPAGADFFCPPPLEIGQVLSAESTLRTSNQPTPLLTTLGRLAVTLSVCAGVLIPLVYLARNAGDVRFVAAAGAVFVTFLAALVVVEKGSFGGVLSYVGTEGVMHAKLKGSRERPPAISRFLFRDAAWLRAQSEAIYRNGVYDKTVYKFTWYDNQRAVLFEDGGCDGTFVTAAERVWSIYLLKHLDQELQSNGMLRFIVFDSNLTLFVAPGVLRIQRGKETEKISSDKIASIKLEEGVIRVRSTDARWYRSRGKLEVAYNALGNAALFLMMTEKLLQRPAPLATADS